MVLLIHFLMYLHLLLFKEKSSSSFNLFRSDSHSLNHYWHVFRLLWEWDPSYIQIIADIVKDRLLWNPHPVCPRDYNLVPLQPYNSSSQSVRGLLAPDLLADINTATPKWATIPVSFPGVVSHFPLVLWWFPMNRFHLIFGPGLDVIIKYTSNGVRFTSGDSTSATWNRSLSRISTSVRC